MTKGNGDTGLGEYVGLEQGTKSGSGTGRGKAEYVIVGAAGSRTGWAVSGAEVPRRSRQTDGSGTGG